MSGFNKNMVLRVVGLVNALAQTFHGCVRTLKRTCGSGYLYPPATVAIKVKTTALLVSSELSHDTHEQGAPP